MKKKNKIDKIAADDDWLLYEYLIEGFKKSGAGLVVLKMSFLILLQDFLNKELDEKPSVYMLETFASDILYQISKPPEMEKKDPKFADILDVASDITFYYEQRSKNKKNKEHYEMLLDELQKYLHRNMKMIK